MTRKNDSAPYFIQTRMFQRGLLKLAFDETGGDIEWASATLGISEEFFQLQATRLGGVFPGSDVHEPPLEAGVAASAASSAPNVTLSASNAAFGGTKAETKPEAKPKVPSPLLDLIPALDIEIPIGLQAVEKKKPVEDLKVEVAEELFLGEASEESSEESAEASVEEGEGELQPASEETQSDEEKISRAGRRPAVSPDPNFLTRREVETLLNLSTSGVLRLHTRGELEGVHNTDLDALLFSKEKVEEFARKRAEQREKRKG